MRKVLQKIIVYVVCTYAICPEGYSILEMLNKTHTGHVMHVDHNYCIACGPGPSPCVVTNIHVYGTLFPQSFFFMYAKKGYAFILSTEYFLFVTPL